MSLEVYSEKMDHFKLFQSSSLPRTIRRGHSGPKTAKVAG